MFSVLFDDVALARPSLYSRSGDADNLYSHAVRRVSLLRGFTRSTIECATTGRACPACLTLSTGTGTLGEGQASGRSPTSGRKIVSTISVIVASGTGFSVIRTSCRNRSNGRAAIRGVSILTRIAQQVGGSFGVAVLAVILQTAAVGAHTLDGIADAFDTAFWWAVGFTVLAIGLSFLLPGRRTVAPVAQPVAGPAAVDADGASSPPAR